MKNGDHLVVGRTAYTHHGIYIGNGTVIHYSDDNGVEAISLDQFKQGKQVCVRHYDKSNYSPTKRVKRAKSRLGENEYCLVTNNCEHLATWVASDKHESKQVTNVASSVTTGVAVYVARRVAISEVSKEAAKYVVTQAASKALVSATANVAARTALTAAAGSSTAGTITAGLTSSAVTGATAASVTSAALSGGSVALTASLATPIAPIVIGAAIGVGAYYAISSWFD